MKPKLKVLTLEMVSAIADAAESARDERIAQSKADGTYGRILGWEELDKIPPRGPAERRLRKMLIDLPHPQLVELQALMWIGRGSEEASDLRKLVRHIEKDFPDDHMAAVGYVEGKGSLHEYLRAGVELLSQ